VIVEGCGEIDVSGRCGLLAHFLDHGTELLRGCEPDSDGPDLYTSRIGVKPRNDLWPHGRMRLPSDQDREML
jgi:hypothetical protein